MCLVSFLVEISIGKNMQKDLRSVVVPYGPIPLMGSDEYQAS
jgi:hypothetical protein